MKSILILLCLYCLTGRATADGQVGGDVKHQECEKGAQLSTTLLSSIACLQNKIYRLDYDRKLKKIKLISSGKEIVLQRIPKERDPTIVGTDKLIGFLSDRLQIYKTSNVLLYTSSSRTNAGSGGGQCGAGSEIYLNFLDLNASEPIMASKILIGSCDYSIELDEQDAFEGKIGDISVEKDKLLFHFLNYKNIDGSPTATIATNRKELIFK